MATPKAQKKPDLVDWHPADVVAALRKKGWSLQQLALANGYTNRSAFSKALYGPYPRVEGFIAEALEVDPETLWPSRYGRTGLPNRKRGPAPMRPAGFKTKCSTPSAGRNPQSKEAA